jgi:hypothetical protein
MFLGVHDVWAQSYRNAVEVPPVEVYQSMLNFVDRKEYGKVVSSLNILAPIANHISAKYSENPALGIKKAVDKGNPADILLSVQSFIVLDMKDLLDEALKEVEQSPDTSKTLVKTARLNYELLSPFVQKADFPADQKIKKNFTDSFRLLESGSIYSTEKTQVNVDQLKRLWVEIVSNLSKVFP